VKYFEGIGRRKTTTARVRIYEGKSMSTINGKPYEEYFNDSSFAKDALVPFSVVGLDGKMYFTAKLSGGGTTGQLGALTHGIGRALIEMNADYKVELRKAGFITRDPRMVERKKYNQPKARKKSQFSKR
jgi:small subunit ribosomal protein S9